MWTAPDGRRRWLTRPGDPTPHTFTADDDGVAIVAHGSLPSGADPRNTDGVRDPTHPATPRDGPRPPSDPDPPPAPDSPACDPTGNTQPTLVDVT
ncbi:MAG: hypothetical protein ACRDUY_02775 [Nitriliruptorales bacterium]